MPIPFAKVLLIFILMSLHKNIISVNNLSVAFLGTNKHIALQGISFALQAAQTLAIVGESGSGKSIAALTLIGLQPKNAQVSGQLFFQDQAYTTSSAPNLRGDKIGFIFQEPMSALNPIMKVGEQIAESIRQHQQVDKNTANELCIKWLSEKALSNPEDIAQKYPHQLSGGQKQRVMIAMAMCNKPQLLIADEPTTALDVTVQAEIIALMRELQSKHHMAMIFITHDLALAATIAHQVLVLQQGRQIEYGNAQQIFNTPQQPYTKALLLCKPSAANKGFKLPIVADFINQAKPLQIPLPKVAYNNNIALALQQVHVSFKVAHHLWGKTPTYFNAVNNASFQLQQGKTLGLIGESGSGKSTIARAIMALVPVQSGQIHVMGKQVLYNNALHLKALRKQVQLIFQDPFSSLNPRHTIGYILSEPMVVHRLVPKAQQQHEVEKILDMVQLPKDALKRYPHQFSGGQRQRIGIARALAMQAKILICDESLAALDVSVQAQLMNLLKSLQQELQLSYLFISHDLAIVYYMSDTIMVMHKGNIVEQGDAATIFRNPQHVYTQKLLNAATYAS